jgi:hypothetical protein
MDPRKEFLVSFKGREERAQLSKRKSKGNPVPSAQPEALHPAGNMPVDGEMPPLTEKHRNAPGVVVMAVAADDAVQIPSGDPQHGQVMLQSPPLARIEEQCPPGGPQKLREAVLPQKIAIFRIVIHHHLYFHSYRPFA